MGTFREIGHLCNRRLDPIVANHLEIVKPKDNRDKPYAVFKEAFTEVVGGKPDGLTAELSGAENWALLKLYISNQLPRLYEVHNLTLNWEYERCAKIETKTVKRTKQTPGLLPLEIVTYGTDVAITHANGRARMEYFGTDRDYPRRPRRIEAFSYANGQIDSFFVSLNNMPKEYVGQTLKFWASFDFKSPGEQRLRSYSTNPVTSGSCTHVKMVD